MAFFRNDEEKELLKMTVESLKNKIEKIRDDYDAEVQLNSSLTNLLSKAKEDLENLIAEHEKLQASFELMKQKPEYWNQEREKLIQELKRQCNHAYNAGRQDAYNELGVKALEVKRNGNTLYITEDGDMIEDISDNLENIFGDDEITIDDLLEVAE